MLEAAFDGFTLRLSPEHVAELTAPGERFGDAVRIGRVGYVAKQFAALSDDTIRRALASTGGWLPEELNDADRNRWRLLWVAASMIAEGADYDEA